MAEGWLRHLAGERVAAESAGTRPGGVHPRAIAAMAEVGVDITGHTSDPVERYLASPPDLVIAVCPHAAEACPSFPGATRVLRWPFPDPAEADGAPDEIDDDFRAIRDSIRVRIERWIADGLPPLAVTS